MSIIVVFVVVVSTGGGAAWLRRELLRCLSPRLLLLVNRHPPVALDPEQNGDHAEHDVNDTSVVCAVGLVLCFMWVLGVDVHVREPSADVGSEHELRGLRPQQA